MFWFCVFIAVILTAILAVQIYWVFVMQKAQKQYLQEARENGRPTMWDVREVLKEGDRDLAVQLYCEIFSIEDIERARKEVDELGRSLNL